MSEQYQIQVTAPLTVGDIPPGKAIASPLPRDVKLTFHDRGWRLAKLVWGSGVKWAIDLRTLPPRQHALTLRDISDQLGGRIGTQPTSMYPESLYVLLDSIGTRKVAVASRCVFDFPEGFAQVGPVVLQPESVTVTGARRLLSQLRSWPTADVTFEQVRQDVDTFVLLSDSVPSFSFSPDRVRVVVNVEQVAEKAFASIEIEMLSVPPNREVILSSPRMNVVLRGGIEQLALLRRADIRISVNYRDILADTSGYIEPEVTLPASIRVVKKSPERLQYVVRKK